MSDFTKNHKPGGKMMDEEEYWRVPKPRKVVKTIVEKIKRNKHAEKGKKVVKEIAETFKERTKLSVTTAVAYMLWLSFYHVIREALNIFLPVYSGLFGSVVELLLISLIAAVTLYLLSQWK